MKIPIIFGLLLLVGLASVAQGKKPAAAAEEEEEEDRCPSKDVEGAPSVLMDAASTGTIESESGFFHQSFDEECYTENAQKYRTANGECNHVFNLGTAKTPFRRLIPAAYADYINSPRSYGVDGDLLPSAAEVSTIIHTHESSKDPLTTMFMQWGQFIDHDITLTPVATKNKKAIQCCGPNHIFPAFMADPQCYPIKLRYLNNRFQGNCMNLVRSLPARDAYGHQKIPREQVNEITAFIDGSMIYGSSLKLMNELREKLPSGDLGARMRTSGKDLLPPANVSQCIIKKPGQYCFKGGDPRVNVQPGLAVSHTMFVRLHNLIVEGLRKYALLTGEELFQEARKIVIAIVQSINYGEWLPYVIGNKMMKQYNLKPGKGNAPRCGYNAHVDPQISNAFATAAFRFGHSNIGESLYINGIPIRFKHLYFRPQLVFDNYEGVLWSLLDGSKEARSEKSDIHMVTDVNDHLFEPANQTEGMPSRGMDLAALNIQRGRDHGLPSFNKFRKFCGLPPVTDFTEEFGIELGRNLKKLYRSVENLDLFVGGLLEDYQDNAHVGPTFACIIAQQFQALKFGDKFYFETDRSIEGFTDAQLANIRGILFAHVCCWTSELKEVPMDVFKSESRNQAREMLNCTLAGNSLKKVLNFKLWKKSN